MATAAAFSPLFSAFLSVRRRGFPLVLLDLLYSGARCIKRGKCILRCRRRTLFASGAGENFKKFPGIVIIQTRYNASKCHITFFSFFFLQGSDTGVGDFFRARNCKRYCHSYYYGTSVLIYFFHSVQSVSEWPVIRWHSCEV